VHRDREIAGLSGRLSRPGLAGDAVGTEASRPRVTAPGPARALDSPAPLPPNPQTTKCAIPSAPAAFTSLIVADFPALFAEFRGKRFTLLWRCGRDGFRAEIFHLRCDTYGNGLTLIQDEEGNVFGGFTPVERALREWNWKLGRESNCFKADPSLMSFVFTSKKLHNFPASKFALKAAKKDHAISCNSACGPKFCDIVVRENCSARTDSVALCFGDSDANDTGLDGEHFLTSSPYFTVKEIDVFEITN
jgi:hypothetical protein